MKNNRFVVMGAGEVGFHLAQSLSLAGHSVVVVEIDPGKRQRIEEKLDVGFVLGSGSHVPVLQAAEVGRADLFLAVSSNDEANLAASLLARHLGAQRTAVRVGIAEEVTIHRRIYEDVFGIDLMLSTQLLATTQILHHVLGHHTLAVEYLAQGKVQLRKIQIDAGSLLTRQQLRHVRLPRGSLVVAFQRGERLIVPAGNDRAEAGDRALILSKSEVIDSVEQLVSARPPSLGTIVIAGGSNTSLTVARALAGKADQVKIIERDRARAKQLAALLPKFEILHGDATDMSLLRAERIDQAAAFVALTGSDEANLMASLLAQELAVPQVVALVDRTETSHLWRKLGLVRVVSPRTIAHRRIQDYIDRGFSSNIVSLQQGQAQVIERRLEPASPAAGVTLAEMSPPRGVIVGAVVRDDKVRGEKVFVPRGKDRLEVGDTVILFVQDEELATVNLLFPGHRR